MEKMTPELWIALERLARGPESHNFREHTWVPTSWHDYNILEGLGFASWREWGKMQEWEEYSITDEGLTALENYKKQRNDTPSDVINE